MAAAIWRAQGGAQDSSRVDEAGTRPDAPAPDEHRPDCRRVASVIAGGAALRFRQ